MPILKATPKAIMLGIRDVSRRTIPREPESLPQHLPLIFLLTERGPERPEVVVGESFNQIYGSESWNYRGKYATHQTVVADFINREGNQMMVQRIKPDNAKYAMLRLSVEVIPCEIPLYERETDGSVSLDNAGDPIQEMNGLNPAFAIGQRLIWRVSTDPWAVAGQKLFGAAESVNDFRLGTVTAAGEQLSTLVNASNATVKSKVYPIADFEVSHFGDYGNRVGLRLSAPNADDMEPGDTSAMNAVGAYLYRFMCVEKAINQSTPDVITTIAGETVLDLAFKNGIYHPQSDLELSAKERLVDAYQKLNDPSISPIYGPFGRMHVYETELAEVLGLLIDGGVVVNTTETTVGEKAYDVTAANFGRTSALAFTDKPQNMHLLNLLTGVDQNGVPYWTFDTRSSVKFGGVAFSDSNIHYATNGSDGLASDVYGQPDSLKNLEILDKGVASVCNTFGNGVTKFLDVAKYPCSTIWDSGFSMNTKKALAVPMSRRKDIWVVTATQAVAEYDVPAIPDTNEWKWRTANTSSEETNNAGQLRSTFLNTPESALYGTPACRGFVVGRTGRLINHAYKGILPLSIELAGMVARWMGAGDGSWKDNFSIDEDNRNIVANFHDINITYQSELGYDAEWDNGLIWAANYDRRSQFFPALQSVYPDDTSVLNSLPTVAACCELQRIGQAVWRDLVGNSALTELQFIDLSNRKLTARIEGRFGKRFVFIPETIITGSDAQRGYSWTTNINIYAPNMRTVNSISIISHRVDELTA